MLHMYILTKDSGEYAGGNNISLLLSICIQFMAPLYFHNKDTYDQWEQTNQPTILNQVDF